MNATTLPDVEQARFNMVEQQIRPWNVLDNKVLDTLFAVRREQYVPVALRALAFSDLEIPLQINGVDTCETMLAPKYEARFAQDLQLQPTDCVLEIGTGSGYQAAVLAKLARRVYTVERFKPLSREAEKLLINLGIYNVVFDIGDGSKGWAGQAPFDRIIVTAAAEERPQALVDQLAMGGILIVPVGRDPTNQVIERIVKSEDGLHRDTLMPVRFVPLVTGALPILGQG